MTSRFGNLALATCACLILAACGAKTDPAAAPPAADASAASTPSDTPTPSGPPIDPRIEKVVVAGLLTAADLPNYQVSATGTSGANVGPGAAEGDVTCLGSKAQPLLGAANRQLVQNTLVFVSSSSVAAAESSAQADFADLHGPKATDCAKKAVVAALQGVGASVQSTEATAVSPAAPHADDAFGIRVTSVGSIEGQQIQANQYLLGARVGATEISVIETAPNSQPFTLDGLAGLLDQLAQRVRAARTP